MADSLDNAINRRIFWTMAIATGLSVIVSAVVGPWRFTTGLLLGGLLALFSHRWLIKSAAAAIQVATTGAVKQLQLARFLLRYLVIAGVVFATYTLDLVFLPAVLAGLSTFVVGLMVEALREFYFAIIEREEIS